MTPNPIDRAALLEAWPVARPYELVRLAKGIGSRLLSAVGLRQELIQSVRSREDLPDVNDRMLAAMGDLSFVDQDAQKSWWSFVKFDLELIRLAVQAKLDTRYMLPSDTAKLFGEWMERGGGLHKGAQLVWDKSVSHYARPFILEGVLDPIEFNQEHLSHWQDRIVDCWAASPPQAKASVVSQFLIHGTPPSGPDHERYATRHKWIMQWASLLLDGSPTTLQGVQQGIEYAHRLSPRLDESLVGAFQSHVDASQIEQATQALSSTQTRPRL